MEYAAHVTISKVYFHTLIVAMLAMTGTVWASDAFHPGEVWRDTGGNPINAHGGGILFREGIYYWYGEAKHGHTILPDSNASWSGTRVEMGEVSCYSSTDLLNWTNEGTVLASSDDRQNDLYHDRVLERPKVIYNQRTGKFVMWMHIDSPNYAAARCGVAVSDRPTGPFKYLGSFRPDADVWPENVTDADRQAGPGNALARDFETGQMARDMTIFMDDDGHAYLFYASEDNATMHVSLLTDDYLHTMGRFARIFIGRSMEAPTVFKLNGKYYFVGSGCTGWAPNAARSAMANHPFGPWTELGNPCLGLDAEKTFHTQGTFVLPVQGRPGNFIFMADRWKKWDLSNSTYVWLPVEMQTNGTFTLHWQDSWDPARFGRAIK